MRLIVLLVLFVLSIPPANSSSEITTQIHDIDMGNINEKPLIFLASGQVVTFPDGNKFFYDTILKAIAEKKWFKITLNDQREILSLEEASAPLILNTSVYKSLDHGQAFTPSILKDMEQAIRLFNQARTDAKQNSQCFNRAHVWSYEWRIKNNLYSSKAWIFFTRRFIRKYNFEWWFHVAPMVHVAIDGKVKERVMEIRYSKAPLKLKQWTNIFMRNGADCPVVEKFTDQADFPESGSCFLMKSSMYYYQPIDLELAEMEQIEKTMWLATEVRHAYMDAFNEIL